MYVIQDRMERRRSSGKKILIWMLDELNRFVCKEKMGQRSDEIDRDNARDIAR